MKNHRRVEQLPYREGTWFAIPLRQGGFAAGRVARHSPNGRILLVYLFRLIKEKPPTMDEIERLTPHEALKVMMCSDGGIIDNSWPVIGDSSSWEREKWLIPPFIRRDDLSQIAWRVVYSDADPNKVVSEQPIPYETTGMETNSLFGHKAAEHQLSALLEV